MQKMSNPQPSRFTRYIDFSSNNISINGHHYPPVSEGDFMLDDFEEEEILNYE